MNGTELATSANLTNPFSQTLSILKNKPFIALNVSIFPDQTSHEISNGDYSLLSNRCPRSTDLLQASLYERSRRLGKTSGLVDSSWRINGWKLSTFHSLFMQRGREKADILLSLTGRTRPDPSPSNPTSTMTYLISGSSLIANAPWTLCTMLIPSRNKY